MDYILGDCLISINKSAMVGITNYTVRTRRVTGTKGSTETFGLCGGHADFIINTLTHKPE